MDIINNLLAPQMWPSGFWESIIKWFAGVGSIAVAIILLTICIKLVLFPLDFWQKRVSRKMTENQAIMKPELDEIQQKYGKNPQLMQQKQQEVYRKYNAQKSMSGGCVAMLVYMILTMVIFFTLFGGLRNISQSQINYEYYTLEQEYRLAYQENQTDANVVEISQNRVLEKYDNIRQGFMSIKNIWRPDNWSTVFPKSDEFLKSSGMAFKVYQYETGDATIKYIYNTKTAETKVDANEKNYVEPYVDLQGNIYLVKNTADGATNPTVVTIGDTTYNAIYPEVTEQVKDYTDITVLTAKNSFVADYDTITAKINEKYDGQWNGYLILIILSGVITFLSSWFANVGLKAKDQDGNIVKPAKPKPTTGIILAVVMIFFTFSYTSAFAIYIIVNSLISMLLNYLTNIILNKVESKKQKKEKEAVLAEYVRK